MILPTKHLSPDRALLSLGGEILSILKEPKTISLLWDSFREAKRDNNLEAVVHYDWFVLALDLLYIVDAIRLEKGVLHINKK